MKRINLISAATAIALLPLICWSCNGDDTDNGLVVDDNLISFVADLPGVSSRATHDPVAEIAKAGFTVSAFRTEDEDGPLEPHFQDEIVTRQVDGIFRSNGCVWASNEKNKGHLKFFAFHPSRVEMMGRAGVGEDHYVYTNATTKSNGRINYDYRLTKFRIAPDISRQVDFVIATGEGNKTDNLYNVIPLTFEHQLSGVEISVWGASDLYDIEVAGVRIGGTIVEADFSLSDTIDNAPAGENTIGKWYINSSPTLGYVDYVFTTDDKVVCINASNHNTKELAASIMGNGGKAMLIPYKHDKWNYVTDRTNSNGGMYFSALIRMTERAGDQHRIFPSTDPQSQDHIVYLSVRKSDGTVMERLDKNGNVYGTGNKYNVPADEEVRHYGWAAVPVNVEWKAGYTYSYVLDYTNGVGVYDPASGNPASTIINWGGVEVTTTTGNWSSGAVVGGVIGSDSSSGSWGSYNNNTAPDGTVWWK